MTQINMNDSRINNITQLKNFLKGTQKFDLSLRETSIEQKYKFIDSTVDRLDYKNLSKKDKGVVICYLKKFTGYKSSQLYNLIDRASKGKLKHKKYKRAHSFRKYAGRDIKLLEKTDELHLRLSEKATKEILRRELEVFNHLEYENISKVSHSHVSNLRKNSIYVNSWVNHTKARQNSIGTTAKPNPQSKPGSVRVDTVHQRDIYHINSVDEITQWEIVACVPRITEEFMIPIFHLILDQFPFKISNFHSDRGSESVNHKVSQMLQELNINQTKSRAGRPNDNALVESKNGSVIRKNMGYAHIKQYFADPINNYYKNLFNVYLNYHRPSAYPIIEKDQNGKIKRIYENYQVPYEKLKSMPSAKSFLKKNISFEKLDKIAYNMSDNEFASLLRKEERKLFRQIYNFKKIG